MIRLLIDKRLSFRGALAFLGCITVLAPLAWLPGEHDGADGAGWGGRAPHRLSGATIVMGIAYPTHPRLAAHSVLLIGYAVILEVGQLGASGRHASFDDFALAPPVWRFAACVSGSPVAACGAGLSNGNEPEAAGVLLVEDFHLPVFHIAREVHGKVPSADRNGERRGDRPVGPYWRQQRFASTGLERKLLAQIREIEEQVGDVGRLADRRCSHLEGRPRPPDIGMCEGRRPNESEVRPQLRVSACELPDCADRDR